MRENQDPSSQPPNWALNVYAQSICNKFDEFKSCILQHSLKIVAITEIWCNETVNESEIHLDNYKVYRNDKQSGRGGGILLYIHCSLNFTPCVKINNLDSIWGSVQLNSNEVLFVGVVYRSPSSDVGNNENNHVIQKIYQFCSFTQLLLIGYFNYPEINLSFSTVSGSISSPAVVFRLIWRCFSCSACTESYSV